MTDFVKLYAAGFQHRGGIVTQFEGSTLWATASDSLPLRSYLFWLGAAHSSISLDTYEGVLSPPNVPDDTLKTM